MGVRNSCDSTPMNVSRTVSRWRAAVTSRRTTMVSMASGGARASAAVHG
jgi:hypothetical protein